jgi:hypothetical protein
MRNKKDKPVNYLSHAHFEKWIQIKGLLYFIRAASSKISAKMRCKKVFLFCENGPKRNQHLTQAIILTLLRKKYKISKPKLHLFISFKTSTFDGAI